MPYEETGPEGPAPSSVDGQTDKAQDTDSAGQPPPVAEATPLDKMTIAEALDKAVAVLVDREILGLSFNYYGNQSSEQVIDYGFKWLIDEQFQTVWDGELGDWWPILLHAVLGTPDPQASSLLIEELALIRE